ncbi:MAG TPA: hypothetical protein VFU96_11850 [Acidimicrobiia bacterium]|nr:hypothetical protein [Acidimicrobiia bacterium]
MPKPDHPRAWRQRLGTVYTRYLPVALGLTAVVNLALTPFLPGSAAPIRTHPDGSLTELVHTEQRAVDRRFGFYMELDDASDGGILIVPRGSFVNPELAEGFAGFEVLEAEYDPRAGADSLPETPERWLVETDSGDLVFSIVPGSDNVWWLAERPNGEVVVVPNSVVPAPVSP